MIFSNILSELKDEWNIKEKVRYIFRRVGEEGRYDKRFTYSSNPKLLNEIYFKEVSIDEDIEPEFVCNTANLIIKQLLDRAKIKCKLIYKTSKISRPIDVKDVAMLFYDENDKPYYASIIGDIQNYKFRM